jgi:membrane fusion protein (multidrug efflux system)
MGLVILILAVGVPYGWNLWHYYRIHESTDDAYVTGDMIPVSARVPGTVASVHVEDHQRVEAGHVLARLDPRDFEVKVQQAEAARHVVAARLRQAEIEVAQAQDTTRSDTARTSATLLAAQSALEEARHMANEAQAHLRTREAAVTVAQAEVETQDAHLAMARMGFDRARQLLADGVVAQQQFDEAENAVQAAAAERRVTLQKLAQAQSEVERAGVDLRIKRQAVKRAQAQEDEARAILAGARAQAQNVDVKRAEVEVTRALLQQQQADLDYARLQLSYATLRAPVAGVIAKKNLEVGQVVQTGRPLMAIVPLHHVWVEANFKETQLRHMRPGQPVTLHVDAYPGVSFQGTVASISPGTGAVFSLLPPENATGNFVKVVQRIPVKIALDDTAPQGSILRPGMSVIAVVRTRD